ncbi:hypothetical protein ACWD3J_15555 [Streptomyces sp. NPDC002755]
MPTFPASSTPAKTFIDLQGQDVAIRPVWDESEGRVVVELTVNGGDPAEFGGVTLRLSNALVPGFVDFTTIAAFLAETANVAEGNPTLRGV